MNDTSAKYEILAEVAEERSRQDEKFGVQDHPDGTGGFPEEVAADMARAACQQAAAERAAAIRVLRERGRTCSEIGMLVGCSIRTDQRVSIGGAP